MEELVATVNGETVELVVDVHGLSDPSPRPITLRSWAEGMQPEDPGCLYIELAPEKAIELGRRLIAVAEQELR